MAKKTTKKASKKPSKPVRSAKKAPAKAKPAAKAAKAPAASASRPKTGPVSSGSGATPKEIGDAVVAHINSGAQSDAPLWDKYWSPDFVSIEGMGMQWVGRKDVQAKNDDWMSKHQVYGASAEGPYAGATGFAVKFKIDVEVKETKQRMLMEEMGVYGVKNGKVVSEEFMYGTVTPVQG